MNTLLQSSKNPEQLSLTIKGYLLSILPLLIGVFQALDLSVAESDLLIWIQVTSFLVAIAITLYGWIRKIVIHFKK